MEMRQVFAAELENLIQTNKNIIVLNADLAKPNGLGQLIQKYPDRVFNLGIAEQNMASVAAGMSSYGFIPFIVTFTPFATRRICDQIAVSIAYAKQNVKIIGTDPGITAELNGGTHMSVEDISVIRGIPNMMICEPTDTQELKSMMSEITAHTGSVYMRMPRKNTPDIPHSLDFDLLKAETIRKGTDISIFSSGIMVYESLLAAAELEKQGIHAEVVNVHTIKPIDKETIINSARKTKKVITAENHNIIGGLRSAVCEVLMEEYPVPLKSIGIKDKFGQVGKLEYLKQEYEMLSKNIVDTARSMLF